MKRIRLKKVKKFKKINFILVLFICLVSSVIYILNIFNERALPIFINYSEIEVERIATLLINNTVVNEISNNIELNDLFIMKQDNNGNIISMDIDPTKVNKILASTNKILEKNFKYIENGEIDKLNPYELGIDENKKGVIYEIPSGIIFKNIFLNNLFPKIPVRLNLVGTVFSKITTNVESFGINNALIKVNIEISMKLKVVLPFASSNIDIRTSIPIIIKIMEGDVPGYYLNRF